VIDPIILAGTSTDSAATELLAPAIVAAIVAGAVSLLTFVAEGRRTRLDRQRQVFADAFEAVMEYREYPFIVRRRSDEEPARERQRISSELSGTQAKLNAFKARLLVENRSIGIIYADLVRETRRVAGGFIREAWDSAPVLDDADMHAPPYDFRPLDRYDNAYLEAVAAHLDWRPWRRPRSPAPGA
jgi:hypothetical protein